MIKMMKDYYMNRECGNIVTWSKMMAEMAEMYDGNDPTNWLNWQEYYEYYGQLDLDN